jgi:hypothetical protein
LTIALVCGYVKAPAPPSEPFNQHINLRACPADLPGVDWLADAAAGATVTGAHPWMTHGQPPHFELSDS